MRLISRLLVVAVISVSLAWGLSYLPEMQSRMMGAGSEIAVFQDLKPIVLSNDNLVDWLSEIPMRLTLKQVEWSYRILAMDYEIPPDTDVPDDVYVQLVDAIRHGLAGTTNVQRVQVRVFEQAASSSKQRKLLVAVDAKRGQFVDREYEVQRILEGNAEEWLIQRFQYTKTKRWQELLRASSI
jgi:hypothetical protein